MTTPRTGWWAKYFVDFTLDVPTPQINVSGGERYPASFTVAVDDPVFSFGGYVRESASFDVTAPNPLVNVDITRIQRSFNINCPEPRMDFLSGERYDAPFEVACPTPSFSFDGIEHYSREFSVATAEPSFNMLGKSIPRSSFGIICPTPVLPMRVREYHAPELFTFTASNLAWQLPDWCDAYDMVGLGAGGGGNPGTSGYANGRGGGPGQFAARTIVRGVDVPWTARAHMITVGTGGGQSTQGSATSMGPTGIAGVGISATQGFGGASGGGQWGESPGYVFTFHGQQYWGGLNHIPASGANYAGWSGCGDGNLGGPGTGGAGGRGALIGGDPGGVGCRGQGWIYCYQLRPTPMRPEEIPYVPPVIPTYTRLSNNALYFQSSVGAGANVATAQRMNNDSAEDDSQTMTAADSTNGNWLMVDLQEIQYVRHIVIGYDYLYRLMGSNVLGPAMAENLVVYTNSEELGWPTYWDILSWTPTYASTGSINGLVTIPVDRNIRCVLLQAQPTNNSGVLGITEFQVWGKSATVPGGNGNGGGQPSGAIPTLYVPYRSGVQSISGTLTGSPIVMASGGNSTAPWVCVDPAGNVYCDNVWSTVGINRVTKISAAGLIQHIVPASGLSTGLKGMAYLNSPAAVSLPLIVDVTARDVIGIMVDYPSVGQYLAIPMQFTGLVSPVDVAVDSLLNIYVTDTSRAAGTRIVKMDGATGAQSNVVYSGVTSPTGICFDSNDIMYVTDSTANKAYKIESNGAATDLGFVNVNAGGIAVGGGMVYVLDTGGNIISRTVGGQAGSSVALPMDGGNNSRIAGIAAGFPFT